VLIAKAVCPVAGSSLGDVQGLQRIFTCVPVNLPLIGGNTGYGGQFFRDGDTYFGFSVCSTRSYDLMADFEHCSCHLETVGSFFEPWAET